MYQNTKSATTAGLLGIFLGAFGAHNWYLGEKGKGIAHVCMMSGGILVEIIAGVILPSVLSISAFLHAAGFLAFITPIALAAMSASGIWGLVEGIIILTQGDAGLAQKGYPVATPAMPQNYGPQPMNGYYGQPMNNGYGMPNNMNMGMNNDMGNMNGMNGQMNNNMQNNMNNQNGGMNNNTPLNNQMNDEPNNNNGGQAQQ